MSRSSPLRHDNATTRTTPGNGRRRQAVAGEATGLGGHGRRRSWGVALVVLLALAAVGGWWLSHRTTLDPGGGTSEAALGALPAGLVPRDLDLLVVTLDTTRADRIGAYAALAGRRGAATPHLDALAARGVLFEQAIAVTPLTLPAHATLWTGLQPASHGVRDNGGFRLAEERLTLAERLTSAGWQTGGFVSAYVLDRKWGIAQGFGTYRDDFDLAAYKTVSMGDIQRRGDDTVAAAGRWLEEAVRPAADGSRRPFFAWVHLYDPHEPYEPPEPFAGMHPGRPYDGEIAWTDHLVGELLATLERLGVAERTVVAVIGDHGESLGEHGETGHGYFVYGPSVRVPFVLAGPYPGLVGRRVGEAVRQVDLVPTLLELLGLGSEAGVATPLQGRSLVPAILGSAAAPTAAAAGDVSRAADDAPSPAELATAGYAESFYARFHYGWAELRSLRTARWAFVEAPRPELYDLTVDPAESRDLADDRRRVLRAFREALAALDAATPRAAAAAAPLEEDEDTLRKLAALGYVGSLAGAIDDDRSFRDLPDPKDRLAVYNLMNRAREVGRSERPGDALPLVEQVLAQDPEVVDAWFLRGNVELRRRRYAEAAAAFRRTLELRPEHDWAMVGLADTLVAEGRVDDAVLGYRRFLERDPSSAQITYRLAQVLLDAGRDGEAEPLFVRTLELEPKAPRAQVGRAVVAYRRQDLGGAHAALDRALALDPKALHARYNRALLLEAEGREHEAAAAYRAELADHPTSYKAWFNLGRLLGRLGDDRGAAAALERAVAEREDFAVGRLFLAQSLLAAGDLAGAEREARRGLAEEKGSPYIALGHYVLADVFSRQGRTAEAAVEVERGRAAERAVVDRGRAEAPGAAAPGAEALDNGAAPP